MTKEEAKEILIKHKYKLINKQVNFIYDEVIQAIDTLTKPNETQERTFVKTLLKK